MARDAGGVYQIGVVPRRIDVITDISGVSFDEAFNHRVTHQVDGRAVAFIGRVELVRNKRATGRPKDLIDANALDPTRAHSARAASTSCNGGAAASFFESFGVFTGHVMPSAGSSHLSERSSAGRYTSVHL